MANLAVLRQVEPAVMLQQLSSTMYDTALQLVVRDWTANTSYAGLSPEDSHQKAMTDFFMTYNLIIKLGPVLPALLLARLGDRGWRKVPIVVPLCGYLLLRLSLLLVLFCGLPLPVMFGAAAVFGLSGGFCSYWAGVMTATSLRSTAEERSKTMMIVELLYGMMGLLGSLASGHLFLLSTPSLTHGTILLISSVLSHLLCLLHSIFLLQVKEVSVSEENRPLLSPPSSHTTDAAAEAPVKVVNVLLLFTAAFLYDFAVGGAVEVLGSFVLKEPLSWSATQVGYGNAAGFTIYITSFLGVIVFRRYISDISIVLIGMLSFAFGIYFTTFVTRTWMFYLGMTLTILQITFIIAALIYIPVFTKIYQSVLDWCPGFVFTLSSVVTVLGTVPVSILSNRLPARQRNQRLTGT
ncbi:thymic stromal cotransporter homolog isoform X2 [Gouania willdenowi]|uniref:thymic stromal cotransporter homolog isoform X2 n=1 Tax=Gouania willdenowi TaxID=441366 RepID=UPI001056BCC7|nr:thymic stromal cotransporter homolog isoform X2 [Gouania willdenowi]